MLYADNHLTIARTGPLSYGQKALWFLQKLAPESVAYNVMLAARISSDVDVDALGRALQSLVDRHACLRTIFPVIKGKPAQQVLENRPVDFRQEVASGLSWDELKARLIEESHLPFDLEKGPLLRVRLFTRSDHEHALSLTVHHIIIDFLSIVTMLDELRVLYAAERTGARATLPDLPLQYLDYAKRQEQMLSGPEGERLWSYWQRQLSGELPVLELPTDRPRPPVQTFTGSSVQFELSEELTRVLKQLADEQGATLYTVLMAGFQALLHRYSGQRQIIVGSPPITRREPELEGIVGFFHNPVALRADFTPGHSFAAFLQQAHRTALGALDHKAYPFALLVERLQPRRDVSRSPIFQVMFVLYEAEGQELLPFVAGEAGTRIDLGGLAFEYLDLQQQVSMLDLTLTMVDSGGALSASLQYNTDLFDAATVARMVEHFESLLEAAARDPQQRIIDLPLLTRTERQGELAPSAHRAEVSPAERASETESHAIDFSLFYFASDDNHSTEDKYRLLTEGAKFADRHGFSAVWTPERHFHNFGGLYPNPVVTGAAISTITERVQIRAGSIVLPLHNPIRVAEDWSVVDNLSKGRAGISVASGWHADDFVFAPENYSNRREVMARHIEIIRKLWRGEPVAFTGGAGNEVQVKIWPRPVQRELPIWVTAFGSIETFQLAGQIGANMLTHLLGQSVELLAEKIEVYRAAWRKHGHGPGRGQVALMLHTFVGEDDQAVREKVREPFSNYLKSSLDLLVGLAQSAGLDIDPRHLTEENLDSLINHAFNRYYETSGLFGTPETCLRMIDRLKDAGVDEVACLIDFGVDCDSVMSSLHYLNILKEASQNRRARSESRPALASRIETSSARSAALPRTEMERKVASIWREVTGLENTALHERFFDLGVDAAAIEKFHSRLQQDLQKDLSMLSLLNFPTISSLSRYLSQDRSERNASQEAQDRVKTRRALMTQQRQLKGKHLTTRH